MNIKKIMAIALAASIPLQGLGYAAYAQSATQVDPEFMSKLEAALEQRPELVLMAAQRAQQRQQAQQQAQMNEMAGSVRAARTAKLAKMARTRWVSYFARKRLI